MADLSKGAITEDEAVGLLIAEPRPVVFVDTCCLGDIFREILGGKVEDAHRTCLAVQNNIEKPYCHYLFSEQVKEEFFKPGQFIKREIDALNKPISHWNNAVQACQDPCMDFFCGIHRYSRFDITCATDLYEELLSRIAKIFDMGSIVIPSERSRLWGSCREGRCQRPARQGKSSYGDCLICGSMISVTNALRDKGFVCSAYFASSNVHDYMEGDQLHPELKGEFNACGLVYCRSILQAYGFIRKGLGCRGRLSQESVAR